MPIWLETPKMLRSYQARLCYLVCSILVLGLSPEARAGLVFNEDWNGPFVPGLTVTALNGATYTTSGGTLMMSGSNPDSQIIITIPQPTAFLVFDGVYIATGSQVTMNEYANLTNGDSAFMGSEIFDALTDPSKTIRDQSGATQGVVTYGDDEYPNESTFLDKDHNKVRVEIQIKKKSDNSNVGGISTIEYSASFQSPAKDIGRLEFNIGTGNLSFGPMQGYTSVPEPSSLVLLAVGVVSLVGVESQRRRRERPSLERPGTF
jgi:hypothetical protein